jgi:hypothetical protein
MCYYDYDGYGVMLAGMGLGCIGMLRGGTVVAQSHLFLCH